MAENTSPMSWVLGYDERGAGALPKTHTALYRLSSLMDKGYIDRELGDAFLGECGLVDMVWEITWGEDYETPDDFLVQRLEREVQGYVVFIHGWTGNHHVWEDTPGLLAGNHRSLVCIAMDHNGFGVSRFADKSPASDLCNPPAAMRAMENWVNLVKIRRQPGSPQRKVINFVGHSMGAAALFYLNPINWQHGEETRYALAPALLLEDEMHSAFFLALGTGIGIVGRVGLFKIIERAIKPSMIDALCEGATDFVKGVHSAQYDETPRGTTAATLVAMGALENDEIAHSWELFRVMLGHKDRMVGLMPMMDLLNKIEFPAKHLRVVPGTHYMFSIGADWAYQHAQNRELVVQDILELHQRAYKLQQAGHLVG